MLPLAWNEHGDPVEPPPGAAAFRVRRATRGKPAVVYGDDGAPLRVPLTCDAAELSALVGGEPGRYRLDFVDADGRLIVGEPASGSDSKPTAHEHCFAVVTERAAVASTEADGYQRVIAMQNRLLQDMVDRSAEVQTQLVRQISSIMDSAARIVQAADGAGIPQRYVPGPNGEELRAALAMAQPADAAALPEDVPPWATAIEALANQALPVVKHVVNTKVLGLDDAQSLQLLGASPAVSLAGAATTATGAAKTDGSATNGQPAPSPANGGTADAVRNAIAQVLAQLTESERLQAERMLTTLPDAVRTQVVAALSTMPVDEAVAAVRSKLQGGNSS